MKRFIKSLTFVILFVGMAIPAWGQASTEGKEFWVALNMTTGTGGDAHTPFIYITTQHPGGSYTITNPADQSFTPITGLIPPTGYVKINSSAAPGANDIPLNKWYPVGQTAQTMSNQIKNVGLKITTTVDCSVFVGNLLPQSFDAANILPITALQTDYITQDYPGYDHEEKGGGYPVTTILATDNNTQVTITPSSSVLNNNGTATITKTLNAGQVLYITGENRATLSGTTIHSDKKIAVFTGVNNTDVPGPVSARDHLYEQNMPTDYWGTHFVVTRSMKKDANRIRVTASNNGTTLTIDGTTIATINAGQTYEFELCSSTMRTEEGYTKAVTTGRGTEYYFDGEAHYLETSCPCAVFSYDVSENYYIKKNGTSERDENAHGDPSMVWISPLEQQLRKVTFGVMNTDNTTTHFVNIITPTSKASSLKVREVAMNNGKVVYGNNLVQSTDIKQVPGNPAYSYARIKLTENKQLVYTITSDIGFIAHVYGSGDKESYAYSCGSAAVQQGVKVDGETFSNGYISDSRFCVDKELEFDASVGTDEITRVDWDFGDGITEYNSTAQVNHTYTVPGWYDVKADLYGHQVCTEYSEQPLGTVQFSFRIVRPDTIRRYQLVCLDEGEDIPENSAPVVTKHDCDSVVITGLVYAHKSVHEYEHTEWNEYWINGIRYIDDYQEVLEHVGLNAERCDSFVLHKLHIKSCLDMTIENRPAEQYACQGKILNIDYNKVRGTIGETHFICGQTDEIVYPSNGSISLPTEKLAPGIYQAKITVVDPVCEPTVLEFPIDLSIYYSADIFKFKFNNVLAVYNQNYNGGYDFTDYQWFYNGQPIPGANQSIYHSDEPLPPGIYYVLLTRTDGVTMPSCSQDIQKEDIPDYSDLHDAPATKHLINHNIVIRKGEKTFNIYGQRIQ